MVDNFTFLVYSETSNFTPNNMIDSLASKGIEAVAVASIRETLEYEERVSSLPFMSCHLHFALTEFPWRFSDIPELMNVFNRALKRFKIVPEKVLADDRAQYTRHEELNSVLWGAIEKYFREKIQSMVIEVVSLFMSEDQLNSMRDMAGIFLRRDDLRSPLEYRFIRDFPITLNGHKFTCSLAVENDYEMASRFDLTAQGIKKLADGLNLNSNPKKYPGDLSMADSFMLDIFHVAQDVVDKFFEREKLIKDVKSGERWGNLVSSGILGKILEQQDVTAEDVHALDKPLSLGMLENDLFLIEYYNQELNALEYASMSVRDEDELKKIAEQKDRAAFMFHVMRGLVRLYMRVLSEGSGGETDFLDGLDPDEKLLVKISSGGNGDRGEARNVDLPAGFGMVAEQVRNVMGTANRAGVVRPF